MISQTISHYKITKEPGESSIGEVYRAPHPSPRPTIGAVICLSLFLSLTVYSSSLTVKNPDSENGSSSTGTNQPPGTPVLETYGKLPLGFEPNQGQTNGQVKFLCRGRGYTLFLTANQAVLSLDTSLPATAQPGILTVPTSEQAEDQQTSQPTTLLMELAGANPKPQIAGLDELPGKSNYLIGENTSKWRTNIPTYARVQYRDVYPGVDLIYYGNPRQLEYDFVLAPGADPHVIMLRFQGADTLAIDAKGDLVLCRAETEIRLQKPLIYQEVDGVRQRIPGGYVLTGQHQVGFQVGIYDSERPLVIDPVLLYSTYLGGSGADNLSSSGAAGIAVDPDGNAYVIGTTFSTDFPTANPLQPTLVGGIDAFVAKLNATGSALVYSTYLGGSDEDFGSDIAVDAAGSAYVIGTTSSADFPTANPLLSTLRGQDDAFVAKLDPSGSALIYST